MNQLALNTKIPTLLTLFVSIVTMFIQIFCSQHFRRTRTKSEKRVNNSKMGIRLPPICSLPHWHLINTPSLQSDAVVTTHMNREHVIWVPMECGSTIINSAWNFEIGYPHKITAMVGRIGHKMASIIKYWEVLNQTLFYDKGRLFLMDLPSRPKGLLEFSAPPAAVNRRKSKTAS